MKRFLIVSTAMIFAITSSGCALNFYKGYPEDKEKIKELSTKLDELEEAKRMLEERLKKELAGEGLSLELTSRGLVITMADDILFDSGKAKLKTKSHGMLKKVADVINVKLPDRNVGIEGHTDNIPIKYSGWKSNWELSAARATSVLHYLIDECGMAPAKLSAIGYGEYKPIADNSAKKGRSRNRRVEIIILPKEVTKKSYEEIEGRASEEARVQEEARLQEGTASSIK